MDKDSALKLVLLGNSGTGKTNIIKALIDKPFNENENSTITASYVSKDIKINKIIYHIEIWDTAGQEKFHSLNKIFLNGAKIVILVYDITNKNSFLELDYWISIVEDILGDEPLLAIFGNKNDLFLNEQVEEDEARKKAEDINAYFRLTSAKCDRDKINQYLEELIEKYLSVKNNNIERKSIENKHGEKSFELNNQKTKNNKKKKCC